MGKNNETPDEVDLSFLMVGTPPPQVNEDENLDDPANDEEKKTLPPDYIPPEEPKDDFHSLDHLSVAEKLKILEERKKAEEESEEESEEDEQEKKPEEQDNKPDEEKKKSLKVAFDENQPEKKKLAEEKKHVEEPHPISDEPKPDPSGLEGADLSFYNELSEDDKDAVDFWRTAEKLNPEKHKGAQKRYIEFLRKDAEKREALEADDPDTPVEENPEYERWLKKHQPEVTKAEARRIDRERYIEEAKRRIAEEQKKELSTVQQEVERLKVKPEVEKSLQSYQNDLLNATPEELRKLYEETGDVEKVKEQYPDEFEMTMQEYRAYSSLGNEFLNISRGLAEYDQSNPAHVSLNERVVKWGKDIVSNPEMRAKFEQQRSGEFVPREQFVAMTPEQRKGKFTLTDQDILRALTNEMKLNVTRKIKVHREKMSKIEESILRKHGVDPETLKKQSPNADKPPVDEPEERHSPRVAASRSPGGSTNTGKGSEKNTLSGFFAPAGMQ